VVAVRDINVEQIQNITKNQLLKELVLQKIIRIFTLGSYK
jgi:hypothetical protein